jgi:hypothetical protein
MADAVSLYNGENGGYQLILAAHFIIASFFLLLSAIFAFVGFTKTGESYLENVVLSGVAERKKRVLYLLVSAYAMGFAFLLLSSVISLLLFGSRGIEFFFDGDNFEVIHVLLSIAALPIVLKYMK